jgi:hypothetical protein
MVAFVFGVRALYHKDLLLQDPARLPRWIASCFATLHLGRTKASRRRLQGHKAQQLTFLSIQLPTI